RKGVLELQELVRVERLALLDRHIALEESGIEKVLGEGDAAEAEARPRLIVEDDLRGVGREIDPQLVNRELRVQVAVGGGVVLEGLLAALIGGLEERFPLAEGKSLDRQLEAAVRGPLAGQLEVSVG